MKNGKTLKLIWLAIVVVIFLIAVYLIYFSLQQKRQATISQSANNITASFLEATAKEIISSKFQIEKDSISQLTIEAIDWPDTSLGCPKEGQQYAQVITLGYKLKIQLKSNPVTLRQFHTNENMTTVLECTKAN